MLTVAVVTLFPQMFDALSGHGVTGRAVERGLLQLMRINPRDFTRDPHRSVDDRPYGGGPGMVLRVEPLRDAIRSARDRIGPTRVVYLTPQGRRLDQPACASFAADRALVLVCGRYEGIDERVIDQEVDEEWSIGDYVVSGGEVAAMVLIDAVTRLLPGVLGHVGSAVEDSFAGGLLDCPHYTRPEEVDGLRVPDVLLGGDHAAIQRWRLKQALGRTWQRRPDLLEPLVLDAEQRLLLREFIIECGESAD